MKRFLLLSLIATLFAIPGKSEVVHLKNGDQVTGDWERVQDNAIVSKTQSLGEVQIPLDKVESVTFTQPGVVLLKNGTTVEGNLTLQAGGNWEVETASGKQEVNSQSLAIIYPAKTYHEKRYGAKRRLWQGWRGAGALGYSLVRGDENAKTLNANLNLSRRIPALPELGQRARTNIFGNLIFANTQNMGGPTVSANSFTAGIRQDINFTASNFFFLLAQADSSQPQSLKLRQTYGAGLGRDIFKRPKFDLQGIAGATYVDEHFAGTVVRINTDALFGEKIHWSVTKWLAFDHTLSYFPTFSDWSNYRIDALTGFSTQVSKRISFNISYADHYLSNPLPGHRKNELILTTGLGVNF